MREHPRPTILGIGLGAITDVQEKDPPFDETPGQMIARWCREMDVPYLGTAQIGHIEFNRVVPFGVA